MPVSISHLRRWVAAALVLVCVAVAGVYFYARKRVKNALREVPEKIGLEVQQSANGFTISKSDQGRTLFKLQASKAIQFRSGGKAELHDVAITVYGSDSSRFDQIYGKDFEYDPQSGDVTSKSEVQIDLQSNPAGALANDQAAPKELKNPIHLRTTQLVFNKNTGDAATPARVDFSVPQANGSAIGARYVAKEGVLTLVSSVAISVNGGRQGKVFADQAVLEKNPREVILRRARAESDFQKGAANEVVLFLRQDNTLNHATASGNVRVESAAATTGVHRQQASTALTAAPTTVTAQKLDLSMKPENIVDKAIFSGNVHVENEGVQTMEAWAGRADVSFGTRNIVTKIHADEQARLLQRQVRRPEGQGATSSSKSAGQDIEITAPAMDFLVAGGNRLTRADTTGPPQVSLLPSDPNSGTTRITADRFLATFDSAGQLSRVHGEAHARVVNSVPAQKGIAQPDRVSTSNTIEAFFRPGTGIAQITQNGNFQYNAGTQQAFAANGRYTPSDQIVVLTGAPRIVDSGMATTAQTVRLNRATGEGFAEGDVRTTYNDLKPQPGGALLASSDPIHVTSQSMVARSNSGDATYNGKVRLWQNANVVEAPSIEFKKDERSMVASSDAKQKVTTVLVATDHSGKATPVNVTADHLTYRDSERKAHYQGSVRVHSSDMTVTSDQADVLLLPASSATNPKSSNSQSQPSGVPAQLDRIIATGSVVITEPTRRGNGDQLTYTAADDKFVLTGGPPSIFDAEHGKITGVSLTLFRRDDRVVVEGDSRSPAVTRTRMER